MNELALTSYEKDILGTIAQSCFQAIAKTPKPPLAFYDTLLSMQAAQASSMGLNQCCPIVRVLLMCEQRTAEPRLRCVKVNSILRMRGKSILILSSTITFQTSFISSCSLLFSLAKRQTRSTISSKGNFSALFFTVRTILAYIFFNYMLYSPSRCRQHSQAILVSTGTGSMLVLFLTYLQMVFRSFSLMTHRPQMDYCCSRLRRAFQTLCSFLQRSSQMR